MTSWAPGNALICMASSIIESSDRSSRSGSPRSCPCIAARAKANSRVSAYFFTFGKDLEFKYTKPFGKPYRNADLSSGENRFPGKTFLALGSLGQLRVKPDSFGADSLRENPERLGSA